MVVRVNDLVPLKHLKTDYGSRVDILSHNFGKTGFPGLKRKIRESPHHFNKLKAIVCSGIIKHPLEHRVWRKRPDSMITTAYEEAKKINTNNVPVYAINHEDFKYLLADMAPKLDMNPNIGTTTIQILLSHFPESLLVAGFSFYMIGKGKTVKSCYIDGHLPLEAEKMLNNRERIKKRPMGHKQSYSQIQADYFKECLLGDCVKVDPGLGSLLNVDQQYIQEI